MEDSEEMGIPDHLTCLLRNLYAGQEATVRTGHGTTDWFQIGKGVCQGCMLSPCLFNLYAEYIRRNAGLEEAQAGIKIARRNINNLRYTDDTAALDCILNSCCNLHVPFYIQVLCLTTEKAMAPHSSTLAWKNPMDGGAWWAAVYGVTQSRTRLKRLSSSSSSL